MLARAEKERRRRKAGKKADEEASRRLAEWRTDFEGAFCPLLDILPKDGPRQKLRLNPVQITYCRERSPRDVILKARRMGFTTEEVARDVWTFLVKEGAQVVIVCQSSSDHDMRNTISAMVTHMFEGLRAEGVFLDFDTESATRWTLPARDSSLRIVEAGASAASASKKGRGSTITRLHVTELAFFEYAAVTLTAMLECVPPPEMGSEICFESTANGASGTFFERYTNARAGKNGYKAHFYAWYDNPENRVALEPGEVVEPRDEVERRLLAKGLTPEQIKWRRLKVAGMDDRSKADQEYPNDDDTCFLLSGRAFFDPLVTARSLTEARDAIEVRSLKGAFENETTPPIRGELHIWRQPTAGEIFIVSADPSEGTGGDPGACVVIDRLGAHVATLHGQFPPWPFGDLCVQVAIIFNGALLVIERNNHGHAVIASAKKKGYKRIFVDRDGKPGWLNSEITRSAALDGLEDAHRTGQWAPLDERIVKEQRTFVLNANGKAEAASGANDDLIVASAIGIDIARRPKVLSPPREVGVNPVIPFG